MDVFAAAFELYLPKNYEQNVSIFENISGSELKQETGMFSEGWWLWPVGRYIEKHGIENVKVSNVSSSRLEAKLIDAGKEKRVCQMSGLERKKRGYLPNRQPLSCSESIFSDCK
jgi:hypothetical protein